ncbi:MAG: hypothetical protein U0263_38180 [Polyangiaceae bacterium]
MYPRSIRRVSRPVELALFVAALTLAACMPSQPVVRDPATVMYADVPFEQLASPAQHAVLIDKDSRTRCLFILAVPIIPFADVRPEPYREGFTAIVLGNEKGVAMHGLLPSTRLGVVNGLAAKTPVTISGRLTREDGGPYFVVEGIERAGDAVVNAPDTYEVPNSVKYSIAPSPPAATPGAK